jgi:hypothetical protein
MDELLYSRVKQLKEIEDRLDAIQRKSKVGSVTDDVCQLRFDVIDMIAVAEQEHADF